MQFLKKVGGCEAIEIGLNLPPDRLRVEQITKDAIQFFKRVLHQRRRQSRPDRFAASLDQTLSELLLDVVHRLESIAARPRQWSLKRCYKWHHDCTDHVAFN